MSALNNEQIESDSWVLKADGQVINDDLVSLALPLSEWVEVTDQASGKPLPPVLLENTDSLEPLLPVLDRIPLICLNFPDAVDGRSYSQASLLKKRYGYSNELRAVGDIQVDQLFLLTRCGFDSFILKPGQQVTDPSAYLSPFSVAYQ